MALPHHRPARSVPRTRPAAPARGLFTLRPHPHSVASVPQVQATNPGHTMRPGRPHNLTSGRVQSTGTMIPHARGRRVREGRGQSLQRRFSAIGGHDRRPPRPAEPGQEPVRGWGCRLTLSSSGRPRPERRPGWQTAIAQPGACARPRRSRSGGCGRVWSRQTRRTSG
jgi:hypothetical protein